MYFPLITILINHSNIHTYILGVHYSHLKSFFKISIWHDVVILMLFHRSCIYNHVRPPKLSWNIYIFYPIKISINDYIFMCRLTITSMSFLGTPRLLALGISPWQGSSLAGVGQFMSPTLGTSNGPSRFQ